MHNLDGLRLRNEAAQMALCALVVGGGGHVRLVASVDHVNAALLWSPSMVQNFNFVWQVTTTLKSMHVEIAGGAPDTQKKKRSSYTGGNEVGLAFILKSLAPRHAGVLKLLAKHQLESENPKKQQGMPYRSFRTQATQSMLVNSDAALRIMIKELEEHQLVKITKTPESVEIIFIPHPPEVLRSINLWQTS